MISDNKKPLVIISTPCDIVTIRNASLKNNWIEFQHSADYNFYPKTHVGFMNCIFQTSGDYTLIINKSKGKEVYVKTVGSVETGKNFFANVLAGTGKIYVDSDLSGLKKN